MPMALRKSKILDIFSCKQNTIHDLVMNMISDNFKMAEKISQSLKNDIKANSFPAFLQLQTFANSNMWF